jgi:hypothetical protein
MSCHWKRTRAGSKRVEIADWMAGGRDTAKTSRVCGIGSVVSCRSAVFWMRRIGSVGDKIASAAGNADQLRSGCGYRVMATEMMRTAAGSGEMKCATRGGTNRIADFDSARDRLRST